VAGKTTKKHACMEKGRTITLETSTNP
jgi:hypothetical protein